MKAFDWEQIEMHLPTQTKVSIDFGQPHYTQITTDDIHLLHMYAVKCCQPWKQN